MQDNIKAARSLHVASSIVLSKQQSHKHEINPASFLNDFNALPLNSEKDSLSLFQLTEKKKEFQKTKYGNGFTLPKIDAKFVKENPEGAYFFFENKQKSKILNPKPFSLSVLQQNDDTVLNLPKEQDQPITKRKRVEFNTALEIVDVTGRVSTEMIEPEQIKIKRPRFSRLKTLEC